MLEEARSSNIVAVGKDSKTRLICARRLQESFEEEIEVSEYSIGSASIELCIFLNILVDKF